MPAHLRPHLPGTTVFFTVTLAERGSHLLFDEVDRLRTAVAEVRAVRPLAIPAWVVPPDHLHCVWRLPEGDADCSVRWGAIKARFTMAVRAEGWVRRAGFSPPASYMARNGGLKPAPRAHKREAGLWQRRFREHHVRDEDALAAAARRCWINPVKHGLVGRPEAWAWSSIHRDRATR